ncbi:anthrone oxygenase family protein [Pseudonocardia sp. TRM90224]|uniref:anthrone oxygenase family protein n=1 Tax=Pseudonocardia sp. TRM90224 TaxID=2812678 RepID=UPI001E385A42|nr:anthrone oxygenase family protein [Pseudonocardia sp. TRM90224]
MDAVGTVSLIVATLTMGLAAGAFVLFWHTIMPGLASTDDRTFVSAFRSIDKAIINPWFMLFGFLGALVFTLIAAFTQFGRPTFLWTAVALVLYVIVVVITMAINVPLNNALGAAGLPDDPAELAAIRKAFDEARWRAWNLVRVGASVVAFACLTWALVEHGRAAVS